MLRVTGRGLPCDPSTMRTHLLLLVLAECDAIPKRIYNRYLPSTRN